MAMAAWLYAFDGPTIERLREQPDLFESIDTDRRYFTHLFTSINYFVTGDAYPTDHVLAPMLDGAVSVPYAKLENGVLGLVPPPLAGVVAAELAALDVDAVRSRVEAADLETLIDEEELLDLEVLEPGEAPDMIVNDLEGLTDFYADVAEAGLGVVMYVS